MTAADAYIALGSNLNNPAEQLQKATTALANLRRSELVKTSSIYSSRAVGPGKQPDYLNAVVLLRTQLSPLHMLDELQGIEQLQGRERDKRWGPRTLDLDLLLHGDTQIQSERLTLPHPHLLERDFVLYPLREICKANLLLPNGDDLDTLLRACPDNNLAKTEWPLLKN